MSWHVYIRFHTPGGESYWRFVAVCLDAESAGIVERALAAAGQEVKVERRD